MHALAALVSGATVIVLYFDTPVATIQAGAAEPAIEAAAPLGAFGSCTMVGDDLGTPFFVFPPAAYLGGTIRYSSGQQTLTFAGGGVLQPFELIIDS